MNPSAGKLPNASTVKIHNLALFHNLKKSKLHLQCSFNDMLQKAIAIQSGTLIKNPFIREGNVSNEWLNSPYKNILKPWYKISQPWFWVHVSLPNRYWKKTFFLSPPANFKQSSRQTHPLVWHGTFYSRYNLFSPKHTNRKKSTSFSVEGRFISVKLVWWTMNVGVT